MLLVAQIDPKKAPLAMQALAPYADLQHIKLYVEQVPAVAKPGQAPLPPDEKADALADKIVELVRPKESQLMRREALEAALGGYDTFIDERGEFNKSMRNALGAVSKAMRPLFPYEGSPIDQLARRTKHYQPGTRYYLGTRYQLTPLGRRVRDRLVAKGLIFKRTSKT